jgi:hypothetical protein
MQDCLQNRAIKVSIENAGFDDISSVENAVTAGQHNSGLPP